MASPSPSPLPSPTSLADVAAMTASALAAVLNDTEISNSTLPLGVDPSDVAPSEGNYVVNAIIGLLIVLGASVLNALGLNITKLDHEQQQGIPKRQRRKEYLRPLWLGGMGIYIASQLFGSPLALRYLRPDWVAPLGASALVFNFIFAYFLVGTPVTKSDIRGTALIVLGVILIVVFSSINHGLKQDLTVEELNRLWSRGPWLGYFFTLCAFIFGTFVVSDLFAKVSKSRASFSPLPSPTLGLPTSRSRAPAPPEGVLGMLRGVSQWFKRGRAYWTAAETTVLARLERLFARTPDARVAWFEGIGWAVAGGTLAGLCLVFTKAVVKLFWLPGHVFVNFSAIITLLFVIATAVAQIVCLNRALRCADTVVVVPLFYAGYTIFGFINSLIFYDEVEQYRRWVLVATFLSMSVLIGGVVLLSIKPEGADPYNGNGEPDPALRMEPRESTAEDAHTPAKLSDDGREGGGEGERDRVLWEVGSVSDDGDVDDDEESMRKGVGGTHDSRGERGGLLLVTDDDDAPLSPVSPRVSPRATRRQTETAEVDSDDDDGFGEYTSAAKPASTHTP